MIREWLQVVVSAGRLALGILLALIGISEALFGEHVRGIFWLIGGLILLWPHRVNPRHR